MSHYKVHVPITLGPGGHPPDPVSHARLKIQLRAIIDSTDFQETEHTSNACLSLIDIGDQVGICYMYVEIPDVKGIVVICSWDQALEGLDLFRESAIQSKIIDMLKNIKELGQEIRRRIRQMAELN